MRSIEVKIITLDAAIPLYLTAILALGILMLAINPNAVLAIS